MSKFEIVDKIGTTVLWIYKGMDGVSLFKGTEALDAELCDLELSLSSDRRREIMARVSDWLNERQSKNFI
jgi:hypothetical protein